MQRPPKASAHKELAHVQSVWSDPAGRSRDIKSGLKSIGRCDGLMDQSYSPLADGLSSHVFQGDIRLCRQSCRPSYQIPLFNYMQPPIMPAR